MLAQHAKSIKSLAIVVVSNETTATKRSKALQDHYSVQLTRRFHMRNMNGCSKTHTKQHLRERLEVVGEGRSPERR